MSDRPDDLMLLLLRGIRADVSELRADMVEVERIETRLELHDAPA